MARKGLTEARRAAGCNQTAIRKELAILKACLNRAVRSGTIARLPVAIRLPAESASRASALLKHSDLRMMNRYAHASADLMRSAVDGLVRKSPSAKTVGAKDGEQNHGHTEGTRPKTKGQNASASKGKR